MKTAQFSIGQAMSAGWDAFRHRPVHVVIGAFLAYITINGGGSAGGSGFDDDTFSNMTMTGSVEDLQALLAFAGVALAGIVCLEFVFFFVRCFGMTGFLRVLDQHAQGGEPPLSTVVSGGDRFVSMLLWRLLWALVLITAGLAVALPVGLLTWVLVYVADGEVLPGVIFAGVSVLPIVVFFWWLQARLVLGDVLVVDGASPMEALQGTWELTEHASLSAMLYVLGMGFVTVGLAVVGVMMCCVGLIATIPLAHAMYDAGRLAAVRNARS